jgi:hypothetical protein
VKKSWDHTVNKDTSRSSRRVSFNPPFLALVSGVRTASVITYSPASVSHGAVGCWTTTGYNIPHRQGSWPRVCPGRQPRWNRRPGVRSRTTVAEVMTSLLIRKIQLVWG